MELASMMRRLALIVLLTGGVAATASAQTEPAPGQAEEPRPTPDAGTTAQLNCIDQNNEYQSNSGIFTYAIALENKCEARMICQVFAYVLQAKGASQGQTTIILAPKSQGAAAKSLYALRVRMVGGLAQTARECRVY